MIDLMKNLITVLWFGIVLERVKHIVELMELIVELVEDVVERLVESKINSRTKFYFISR